MKIKSYCISLKENEKDRERCLKIFDQHNLNVEFKIVERSPSGGVYGCFESHINIIKEGLTHLNEYDYLLIMEDDVYFESNDCHLLKSIECFLKTLNNKKLWCCCLGYLTDTMIYKVNSNMVKLKRCACTHAYIIPKQTAIKLSQLKWNHQPIDHAWIDVIEQFYAPYPMIAFQKDHISSISKSGFTNFLLTNIGFKKLAKMNELWNHHCTLFYSLLIITIVSLIILYMVYYHNHFII